MDVVSMSLRRRWHGLTINGKLSFADNKDLELTTEWDHGARRVGDW